MFGRNTGILGVSRALALVRSERFVATEFMWLSNLSSSRALKEQTEAPSNACTKMKMKIQITDVRP